MDENIENISESKFYPPKPELKDNITNKKDAINRSLFSMAIFIGIFYFFFDLDIRLVLVVVAALIIHELGHFFTMEKFGYKDLKIFFVPLLGAYVSGENENISQREKALVYLAGPIPGIILGTIFFLAWFNTGKENFLMLATVFIYINAFNLLPVTPLDGGRFIETLFFYKNELIQLIFLIVSFVGIVTFSIYFEYYIFLFFGLLLIGKIVGRVGIIRIRKAMKSEKLNFNALYNELSDEEYWRIREVIILKSPFYKKVPKNTYRYNEREPLLISHVKMALLKIPEKNLSGVQKFLLLILWAVFLASPTAILLLSNNSF